MNRRGFLSLVSVGAAAAAVEAALPAPFRATVFGRTGHVAAEHGELTVQYMAFQSELGFDEIVAPGGVVRLVAYAQRVFQPLRLGLRAQRVPWEVLQVDAGGAPLPSGGMPAELFGETASEPLAFGVVRPGDQIVLALRNCSAIEAEFSGAALMGRGLR